MLGITSGFGDYVRQPATVLETEVDSILGRLLDMGAVETALGHTLAL